LHEVHSDFSHELGEDPGLTKDGVEAHLQVLLAELPESIEPGLTLIRREYPTAVGPVDLLCRDASGQTVAVEIKRRGEIDGVESLLHKPLSRRHACLQRAAALVGVRWTTTSCAAKRATNSVCSSRCSSVLRTSEPLLDYPASIF
jgi:Holliday junction resolvase-like predicted endonuclease